MPAWYAHEPCQEMLSMVVSNTCVNLLHHDESFWHQWDSDGLYVMSTSLANHPCKHLGTGPGVVNVARHSSCHVEALSTRIPTSRSIPLPQTRADNTTPSSSSWHPNNEKTSLRNKYLRIFAYQTAITETCCNYCKDAVTHLCIRWRHKNWLTWIHIFHTPGLLCACFDVHLN